MCLTTVSKYMDRTVREIEESAIIVEDSNTLLSERDRFSR